jgi:hypothetical protein
MDMIFDTATGQLTIDTSDVQPWGADLRAVLNRHNSVINLEGVEMGITVSADGVDVFAMHLPPPGVKYRRTDQDILATGRCVWEPEQAITVQAWCKTNSGAVVTASVDFTSHPAPISDLPELDDPE